MTDLIDDHLSALRAEGRSTNTVDSRQELLRRLDRDLPCGLEKATTSELQRWLAGPTDQLGKPVWCSKTRETYWCHIVAYFRWCAKGPRPLLDYDPSQSMARPFVGEHRPRVAEDDQLAYALANLYRPVLRAVILAAGVGMRASEVADAEREHVTRRRVIIHGKGDKTRIVPVPEDVWDEIRDCPDGPLITHHGQPVTPQWVTTTASRALTRIGLPELSLHWFRGAYATRLRRSGVDAFAIQRLLGHSSAATTQRYIQLDEDDLADAVALLPPLNQPARRSVNPAKTSGPVSTRPGRTAEAA